MITLTFGMILGCPNNFYSPEGNKQVPFVFIMILIRKYDDPYIKRLVSHGINIVLLTSHLVSSNFVTVFHYKETNWYHRNVNEKL